MKKKNVSRTKVVIAVPGRWHGFDLAKGLEEQGLLHRLITIYPKKTSRKWGIPDEKVCTAWYLIYIQRASQRYLPKTLSYRLDSLFMLFFDWYASKNLGRPDLVHAWSGASKCIFRKARRHGARCVLERSSSHIRDQFKILQEEASKCGEPFVGSWHSAIDAEEQGYQEADRVFVPSLFVWRSMRSRGVETSKLFLSGFGADLNLFKPANVTGEGKFTVVYAGSKGYRKGLRYLIAGFREADIADSRLRLIGGGCEQISRWIGDDVRIENHPRVEQSELANFYRAADVFVHPSLEEGQSMVQLQALACGIPLICTTNTGGEDLLRKSEGDLQDLGHGIIRFPAGYVVPPGKPSAIARCLQELSNHPELLALMKSAALELRTFKMSWGDYAKRNAEEYMRIIVSS